MNTEKKDQAFWDLCQANGLTKDDVWPASQNKKWIVSRTGIEKIQALNNIQIAIGVEAAALDFAIVKATATRTVKLEGRVTGKKFSVETLASAQKANSKDCYYAELAEKRAKARAVLMLMGFSALEAYGEDDVEDPKRPTEQQPAQPATPGKPEPEVVVLGRVSVHQEAPTTAAPSNVASDKAREGLIQELIRLIASPELDKDERDVLLSVPLDQRPTTWVENTLAKLPNVVAERKDPKTALEAARKQLRTVAARFQNDMPDQAYKALLLRAQALTAKPEELRAEARQVMSQFQSLAA
jgi:hypothetical protein